VTNKFYVWGEKARNIPPKPGVYGLYNQEYELIYVGESPNLQKTFQEYLETGFFQDACKQATRYYRREFTPDHQKRKKEILEEYKKEYGTQPKCNITIIEEQKMQTEKTVTPDQGFHFFTDIAQPTGQVALSLREFTLKLKEIPITSIEFHQKRGDFAKWIRNIFEDTVLADAVERIRASGEELRKQLIEAVTPQPERALLVNCPKCGTPTTPTKTWSITGKAVKTGIRPKLTWGSYKCPNCGKAFRQLLAKETIKE